MEKQRLNQEVEVNKQLRSVVASAIKAQTVAQKNGAEAYTHAEETASDSLKNAEQQDLAQSRLIHNSEEGVERSMANAEEREKASGDIIALGHERLNNRQAEMA